MPTDAELRIRASVEQAITAVRSIKSELTGLRGATGQQTAAQVAANRETRAGTTASAEYAAATRQVSKAVIASAAEQVGATMRQVEALKVLAAEYSAVARAATKGSAEQKIAARMAADATKEANALQAASPAMLAKARGGWRSLASEVGQYDGAIKSANSRLSSIQGTMTRVGGQAVKMGGLIGVGVVASIAAVGLKFDNMKQQATIAFTTLLGDGGKARTMLASLYDLAAHTPFRFQGITQAAQRLLAMGFSAKELIPTLKAVGDATSALGASQETMDRIVMALGQMRNAAHVNAQDMNQLTQAGINGWGLLAKALGKTVGETRQMAQNGLINSKAAADAILAGMEKRFAGSMERQSHSFAGLVSTIQDLGSMAAGRAMKPLFDYMVSNLDGLVNKSGKLTDEGNRLADVFGKKLLAAVKGSVGFLHDNWDSIVSGARQAVHGIEAIGKILLTVAGYVHRFSDAMGGPANTVKTLLALFVSLRIGFAVAMAAMRIQAMLTAGTMDAALISTGIGAIIVAVGLMTAYIITHWSKVRAIAGEVANGWMNIFHALWDWLRETALKAALSMVEPFSHLPGSMGAWARKAKDSMNLELDQIKTDAANRGMATGDAYGRNFYNASAAWFTEIQKMSADQAAKALQGQGFSTDLLTGKPVVANAPTKGLISPVPKGTSTGIVGTPYVGTHNQKDWQSGNAIDIAVAPNTPVLAVEDGKIDHISGQPVSKGVITTSTGKRLEGYSVTLNGHQNTYFYTHLETVSVRAGQVVKKGTVLGYTSSLGHVHFAVMKGSPVSFESAPGVAAPDAGATTDTTTTDTPSIADLLNTGGGKKKGGPKGLGATSVATMKQALLDLEDKTKGIMPTSLRDALMKRAQELLAAIRKGLGPEETAKLRSDLSKLKKDVADGLRFDTAEETAKTTIAKLRAQIIGLPANLKAPLMAEMKTVSSLFAHIVTAEDLRKANTALKQFKTDTTAALKLNTGIDAAKASVATIKDQILNWPIDVKGPLAASVAAVSRTLSQVLNAKDLAAAKTQLANLKNAVKAAMAASKQAVQDATAAFETQWGRFTDQALNAFDKVTQLTIAAKKISVSMGGYSFSYGTGDLTPAQKALQDLQDKRDQEGRDQAAADALAQRDADQAAYNALVAVGVGGLDSQGNTVTQADIDALAKTARDSQRTLDGTVLDQRQADLTKQADAEQKAADAQFQTWQTAYEATRDVQRTVLENQLTDLKIALETQKTTWAGAMTDIQTILEKGGSDAATAFWTAYNAAQAAAVAAGGSDASTDASGSLSGLDTAISRAAAINAQGGNAANTDPGMGTSPDDRGGIRGVGSAPSFVWGGITWSKGDRATFARWLSAHGATYSAWADNHPTAAAMLQKGGVVTKPTLAMMGEKPGGGAEGVIPLDDPRALALIAAAIAGAMPSGYGGGLNVIFPNAIIPGRDRDAARRLARMAGPEIKRVISYNTSP